MIARVSTAGTTSYELPMHHPGGMNASAMAACSVVNQQMAHTETINGSTFKKWIIPILQIAGIAVFYYGTARLSLLLAAGQSNASAIWPPSGIALAFILIWGYRIGPAVFLGAFFADLHALAGIGPAPDHIIAAFNTAAGNMLEGIVAAYLIRRFTGTGNPFENMKGLSVFFIMGSLVSTSISATTGVLSYCFMTGGWPRFPALWLTWWIGDAAGMIIVAPIIIMTRHRLWRWRENNRIEAFLALLILVVSTTVIFRNDLHLEYLVIPPLIWIALRIGRFEAAVSILLAAFLMIAFTIRGHGPLMNIKGDVSLIYLQTFIGVVAVTALCISVITYERTRADKTITTFQKRLYDIIDFLPDATFALDNEGKVIAWNRAMEIMTGIRKECILGMSDYPYGEPLFGKRTPTLISLLDMDSVDEESRYIYIKRGTSGIQAEIFVAELHDGLGAHLWIVAAPLFDQDGRRTGAIEVVRDITEQKRVEQALRESELLYRTLFETASDAILLLDGSRCLDCNARTLSMFGCERDHLIGATPMDFSPHVQPDGRDSTKKALEMIDRAIAEGPQFFEWAHLRADGTPFLAEVSLNIIELGGRKLLQTITRDITARKKAEDEARITATRIHNLSKYANDFIILLDEDFHLLEVNERAVDAYGYSYEELIGMHASRLRAPGCREEFPEQVKIATDHGKALFETVHVRKDGTRFPVEISLRTIDSEGKRLYQAVIRDITERKVNEMALQESERKYRQLVENANSIIVRWTRDGVIRYMNEYGLNFFGYSAGEIIGRHAVGTVIPETDSRGHDLHDITDRISEDPVAYEKNISESLQRNGKRIWVAWTNKVVLDAGGSVIEVLSVGTDITELKRAEKAIRMINADLEHRVDERTRELAAAKELAEAADRTKSSFLATMSHELRTPLNSIIGFTGIILQEMAGPLNEEQSRQLGMVRKSAHHLLSLINDVLDISKIEAGQLEVFMEPIDVREIIDRAVSAIKPLADKKGLSIEANAGSVPLEAMGDERRVEQVLLNLISNAVKFTETGGITISLSTEGETGVSIRIEDTGIGIRPEDMEKLFQPFRQIDSGLSRKNEGTGLGLAICRRLADLMGGKICAESEWGRGSSFTLILPRRGGYMQ